MRTFKTCIAAVAIFGVTALSGQATCQAQQKAGVGLLEIEGTPPEKPGPLDWLMAAEAPATLRQLVEAVSSAAGRSDIDALVIRLKDAALSTAQIEEIGVAMAKVSASGKKVHLFADSYGRAELLLGSFADEVIMQSGSSVSLPGIHVEEMYLADSLAWLGMKADFVQVGDYKGASETLVNSEPSEAWNKNISQLLDSLYENTTGTIKTGRKLSDTQLKRAVQEAWWINGPQAIELGLIDQEVDLPELSDHLAKQNGSKVRWVNDLRDAGSSQIDMSNPFAMFSLFSSKPGHAPRGDTIAIIHIDGAIVDGDSSPSGPLGRGDSVGSRTIRKALQEIQEHDQIKGVIVRIESPGGSAIASEVIWQGLTKLAKTRPVWVSVGSMAASGGYYIAVAGDRIYVNPSSIVGSIGVVGGKFTLGGVYEKLKLRVHTRNRGPNAGMFSSVAPWTEHERELVRSKMTETYDLFTSRVTAGREGIDLGRTAEGRLFTGNKAIALKMADEIGGLDTAIDDLAAHLSLDDFKVMHYPGPVGIEEFMNEMFKGITGAAPGVEAGPMAEFAKLAEQLVGKRAWDSIADSMQALMELRTEPVLLTSPRVLIFD